MAILQPVGAENSVRGLSSSRPHSSRRFEERGEHELHGVPCTWRLFTARI
jgi:hypothetical protein